MSALFSVVNFSKYVSTQNLNCCFKDFDISQGSVAKQPRCDGSS